MLQNVLGVSGEEPHEHGVHDIELALRLSGTVRGPARPPVEPVVADEADRRVELAFGEDLPDSDGGTAHDQVESAPVLRRREQGRQEGRELGG